MKPFLKATLVTVGALLAGLGIFALVANFVFANNGSDATETSSPSLTRDGDTGKIKVVTSTQVWADITELVGGEWVEVSVIVPDNQDPHSYEATARDQLAISEADLVIANGGGYDSFMDQLVAATDTDLIFLKLVEGEHLHAGEAEASHEDHDHSHDHDHEHEANEHIWFDFALTLDAANHIVEAIVELRPEAKESTTKSLSVFEDELGDLEGRVESLREDALGLGFIATEGVANLMLLNAGFQNLTPDALSDAVEEERDVPLDALEEAKALLENKVAAILVVNITTTDVATDQLIAAAESGNRQVVRVSEAASGANSNEVDDYLSWMNHVIDQLMQAIE